jgi:hypothetical protein
MTRLLLVVAIAFAVISKATVDSRQMATDYATDRIENSALPRFFNLHPADLESRVAVLVAQLVRGQSDDAARELRRLGGAAFPLLVPRLRHLPESAARRIAWVILPVAQRMTWRGAKDIHDDAQAYHWLIESWEERDVDFQPSIAARWVERLLARGGPALSSYVLEYDTYALPALMAALPDIKTAQDIERARQLLWVARRVTGLPWQIAGNASTTEARNAIEHWQRWWQLHAAEYVVVRGPSRLAAMLQQTQFGQWSTLVARFGFGTTRDQRSIAQVLLGASPRTLGLLVAGALGAMSSTLIAHFWQVLRFRRQWSWPALLLASLPPIATVALVRCYVPRGSLGIATLAIGLAMSLGRLFSTTAAPTAATAPIRDVPLASERAPVTVLYWRLAGHNWPWLLTLAFATEKAFAIAGIGLACVDAFRQRDLHMLMAITTITAVSLLLIEFAMQTIRIPGHSNPSLGKPG